MRWLKACMAAECCGAIGLRCLNAWDLEHERDLYHFAYRVEKAGGVSGHGALLSGRTSRNLGRWYRGCDSKDCSTNDRSDLPSSFTDDRAVQELQDFATRFPSIPIVLLCNRTEENLVLDAWHAGAADMLFLPITSRCLDKSFERCAKRFSVHEPERPAALSGRFFYLDETGKECRVQILPPKFTIGRASGNNLWRRKLWPRKRIMELPVSLHHSYDRQQTWSPWMR